MAFSNSMPTKYFSLVPAVFFTATGVCCILFGCYYDTLVWQQTVSFTALFLPLLVRRNWIYFTTGFILALYSLMEVFVISLVLVSGYERGMYMRTPSSYTALVIFAIAFLCSLSLIYAGAFVPKKYNLISQRV